MDEILSIVAHIVTSAPTLISDASSVEANLSALFSTIAHGEGGVQKVKGALALVEQIAASLGKVVADAV